MSKYMKKPVVIEAIQWTKENDVELEHWLSKEKSVELEIDDHLYVAGVGAPYISKIQIKTLEGTMEASYSDYIIKGINGEIYPCKPDIFEKTYEQSKKYLKWEDLEEELGCPLEVREQALKNGIYIKNIDGDMVNFKVMLVYKNKELGYYFRIINDGVVLLKDYKKTWFLKKDKSE